MNLHYQLTPLEFRQAHRTHLRRTLFTLKNLLLLSFALFLGFLQAQALGPQSWANRCFGLIAIAVIGFIAYSYVTLPKRLYRRFHSSDPVTVLELKQGSSGALEVRQGEIRRTFEAQDISHVTRQRGLLLIHPQGGVPIAIPERALASCEDQDTLHAFLARSL